MRRYSRYKICKTNFHFFFFSSRILNFNRPKWSLLKEKAEVLKTKRKLQNNHKTKYSKHIFHCFFNIPLLFKKEKKKNSSYETSKKKSLIFFVSQNSFLVGSSDYSFLN